MYKGKKTAVVIPAYNEETFIRKVVETVPPFVDRIYVIDDASTDRTGDILNTLLDERLVVTTHAKRAGVGSAIISGHKKALEDDIDVIAIVAGDGQMEPAVLDKILDPVVEGKADYSKGDRLTVREHRKGMLTWRRFGNILLTYLNKIASGYWHISDPQCGYTAISRQTLQRIDLNQLYEGYAFENDMLVRLHLAGAQVVDVPIQAPSHGYQTSKIRYPHFIMTTSLLLAKAFWRRLWLEHIQRPVNKIFSIGHNA